MYVTCGIGTTSNTNKYKAKNDRFLVINCQWKRIQIIKITVLNNALRTRKGSYNFKWIRCINDILVAVGRPDLFKTEPVNNLNSVKMDISRTLSDLYIQEWNEKANVSSKGKQYLSFKDNLNFEKYLINVSKFYYSKIIEYRTGYPRLPVETGRCKICTSDDIGDEYHYLFTCDLF